MNQTIGLDLGLVEAVHLNRSAIDERAESLGPRRKLAAETQVVAHLRAIQCLDLTALNGGDTDRRIGRLCAKALRPVRPDILQMLGLVDVSVTVGGVCMYHSHVACANRVLKGRIPIAAVSTAFPHGQVPLATRLAEIDASITDGATEIDVVIVRALALNDKWQELYDEVRAFREVCGYRAKLKVILGVGNLYNYEDVYKAALVAMMAGADTVKTSTGMEPTNATLAIGLVMARAIREFEHRFGTRVGFKPAGGIRTARDAQLWITLMYEELGEPWTRPNLLRLGASPPLLTDLEAQLYQSATGRYPARHHLALA